MAAFFYINDGLFETTRAKQMQRAFDTLVTLFDRVDIWKNSEIKSE